MPYLNKDNLKLHYTDSGAKNSEPIITLHGLSESHLYWSLPGITDRLVKAGYRVISMDMRGHGFTQIEGDKKGYDVSTIAGDIDALANSLNLEKFHLLTHATGGIAAFRYAMTHSDRLMSVMATDTGSATFPSDEYAKVTDPGQTFPQASELDLKLNNALIKVFRGNTWGDIMAGTRMTIKRNVFLKNLLDGENPESTFAMYCACSAIGNTKHMADFVQSFYTDYDPQIAGLRQIFCPVLMLLGEFDDKFLKPAELIAREVPDCKHVIMKGVGHMTAFENPTGLGDELLGFLKTL